jgi:site-specific DNA-methyltransferase (cytosine-N4-specific)
VVEPYYRDDLVTLHHGNAEDVARTLDSGSVQTIVTSPPYFGLRDYGEEGQIGAESTVVDYVWNLVELFRELRRVLADDGTLWLNLGDSYATGSASGSQGRSGQRKDRSFTAAAMPARGGGVAPKNLLGVPWRVALSLQEDGWILRSDIIWAKKNVMPESVSDRPTKAHEYLFLFAKSPRYYYDAKAIEEDADPASAARYKGTFGNGKQAEVSKTELQRTIVSGEREYTGKRNKRDVWTVATQPFPGAHFAVYPPELIRPCILAGSRRGDVVLDPFSGSGTTGAVATQEGRRYVGVDLNRGYLDLSLRTRFAQPVLDLTGGDA